MDERKEAVAKLGSAEDDMELENMIMSSNKNLQDKLAKKKTESG